MVRGRIKWKFVILLNSLFVNVFTKCLPTDTPNALKIEETAFTNSNALKHIAEDHNIEDVKQKSDDVTNVTTFSTIPRNSLLRNVRPGQEVRQYAISLTFDGNEFTGRAVLDVIITEESMDNSLVFHFDDVTVHDVATGVFTEASAIPAEFELGDGVLEVFPVQSAASFIVIVEYTGTMANNGHGLYIGETNEGSYIAMNLHPTNARRVFPCMDELTAVSTTTFRFNGVDYTNIITNAALDQANSNEEVNQFHSLQSPPSLWGMIAHNFTDLNIPIENVILTGRPGVTNQDAQASIAINAYFDYLNEWTNKPYFEIILHQDSRMHIIALPDVDRNWNSLSIIGLWEPYVLMETAASVKQRKTVLVKIAEAMVRQWFGYVIYPQNWRYEWLISGLASYTAYEAIADFQAPGADADVSLLDVEAIFLTDVIQESLLRDAYIGALVLEPESELFDEEVIREHINGLLRYKAPAIMHMISWVIGTDDLDLIQSSVRALLAGRALQTISSQNFNDAVNSQLLIHGNDIIDNIGLFLETWLRYNGYPLIHVGLRQGGVILITQERFSFTSQTHVNFDVPLSYTTSVNPNFDDAPPLLIMGATITLNIALGEEDWVLFNIRGQGYYRVNYDGELWERIILALEDPERRADIHSLNRATLIDDALNLARAGRLDYDIALRVVLTMEHEIEYAVWKAFVRNMDFLRKRLVPFVIDDGDLDPDIYMRMVRRTVGAVENQLGFHPDPLLTEPAMASLTRGLVMDHACRSNYAPCIAAAVDLFYDSNNNVNPNIPYDIRPAVYCTMVKEGDETVLDALNARLEIEASYYERLVILESFACSQDDEFIRGLLEETVTPGNRFFKEERVKIFKAVAESNVENAWIAVNFMSRRTADIRNMYGGDEKLEELIFVLAENMVNSDLADDFSIWVNAQNNNLDDSRDIANRALQQINENLVWNDNFMEHVYEWIDLNGAPSLTVSLVLTGITLIITLFNQLN